MDALPDEMLLHIFSLVADGPCLLDAVALVCKRWLRLSRDRRAWDGVEVSLNKSDADPNEPVRKIPLEQRGPQLASALRVLLHAPHLRRLAFEVYDYDDNDYNDEICEAHYDMKVSALCRSAACIRELDLGVSNAVPDNDVLDWLRRRGHDLRGLKIRAAGTHSEPPTAAEIVGVVASLHQLTELHIELVRIAPYDGELAGALPSLRLLDVAAWNSENAVMDLLRGASTSLREVKLLELGVLSPEVEACLVLCTGVRSAELHLLSLRAVLSMPHLDKLYLQHYNILPSWMDAAGVQARFAELLVPGALAGLKKLRRLELSSSTDIPLDIVAALAQAAGPSVVDLKFGFGRLGDLHLYHAMLEPFSKVRAVHMDSFEWQILAKLASLPQLEQLSGCLFVPETRTCSCTQMEHQHCKGFIQAFKTLRPDVKTKLRLGTHAGNWYGELWYTEVPGKTAFWCD